MVSKLAVILMFSLLAFCESAFIDTLTKCAVDDSSCQKTLIQNLVKDNCKTGVPELNIPPFDPLELKGINIPVLGLMNISLENVIGNGFKDCVVDNIDSGFKERHGIIEVTCDLNLKAKYKLDGVSPLIDNLFGSNSIRGDGNIKLDLEKLKMKIEYFYDIIKKDDGELYVKTYVKKTQYAYELGNVKVSADNIFLGEKDASETLVKFANENWKFILNAFGKNFFDVAIEVFTDIINNFFYLVPAKYYLSTDLSPYVKN